VLSWDDIVGRVRIRQGERSESIREMQLVREHYDGDWVIPIPGTENTMTDSLGPALMAEAVDTMALRVASVAPDILCPAIDPNRLTGVRSIEFANKRRKALEDAWRRAEQPLLMGKTSRHLVAYASLGYRVRCDHKKMMPVIEAIDPLITYPEFRADTDFTPQDSVALIYRRSGRDIVSQFPHASAWIVAPADLEAAWDVFEWHDMDQSCLGTLAIHTGDIRRRYDWEKMEACRWLAGWENKTGLCPVVTTGAISLSTARARLAAFTNQTETMARLTALNVAAAEKSTFPDKYIMSRDGETAVLAGGVWKDGRTGEINIISGAQSIGEMRGTPDMAAMQMADRVERNMRVSFGQSSMLSGEAGSNALRTGRAIDSFMGVSLDPRIAELQRIQAVALQHVNEVVLAEYKANWPTKTYRVFSMGRTERASTEFTPDTHIETLENRVRYSLAGGDADSATVRIGQLIGSGMISRQSGREMHPNVDDATEEAMRIVAEQVDDAVLSAVLARAQDPAGQLPITDLARIGVLVREGVPIANAVEQAQREAQERQAKLAPPAPEGMAAAPQTMPGMEMPGAGAEMQGPPPELADPMATVGGRLASLKSLVTAGRVPYGGQNGPLG
jgi:hypothetical protein